MPPAIGILFGAVLTVVTALALGRTLLRRAGVELYREEEYALGFVTGSATLSGILFVLCVLGWARSFVLLGVAAGAIAMAVVTGAHRELQPRFAPLPRFWKWLFFAIFAVFTVLYFATAMSPEFSPDGTGYHLSFVAKYARAHGFVPITTNIYAQLSQGIELLFLMAFTFGRHSAAALVHYAFLLALTLSVASYGRRAGYPVAGLAAALLVYVSPVAGMDGTCAYIDVAVAAILFSVFYLVQLWDAQRSAALAAIIGLAAGFGYAAKYTAFLAVPYAAGFMLWRARKWKPALVAAACSTILAAPWAVKNIVWAGNPVAPLFNKVFPNPYVHVAFEREWDHLLQHYNLQNRMTIPIEVTIHGDKLPGLLGPVFLLTPLGLFALRLREGRRVLAAGALFALPYAANIGTRFLIPPLPFFAFALALALSDMRPILGATLVLHAVLSWPSVARLYCGQYAWLLNRIPAKQALRIESEDSWLTRKHPDYKLAKMIESKVPHNARILAVRGLPEAYISADVLVEYQSAAGQTMGDFMATAYMQDIQPRCGERVQFPPRAVRKIRVVETGPAKPDKEWSIAELRLYSGGRELPRRPQWRITARPNPWEIPLAFDNSPVTRWRSWQAFEPGMFVEVDLGGVEAVDSVQAEGPADCAEHAIRVDGMGTGGQWSTLSSERKMVNLSPPPFMGKAAMSEIKLRGVDYLLMSEGSDGWEETLQNPGQWGLTEIGKEGNNRLYRIDAGFPKLESEVHATAVSGR